MAQREHLKLDSALLEAHHACGLRPGLCCGTIRAHEAASVSVVIDAAAEQSLRRMLELRVENGPSAYVGVRAEVVARRASMQPSSFELGTTYVRVPVTRTLELRNLTRIETSFECVHHCVRGKMSVSMEPAFGTLMPDETIKIVVTITSETAGEMEVLCGCKLHGGRSRPVGCRLRAAVQGLTIAYEAMLPDEDYCTALECVLRAP